MLYLIALNPYELHPRLASAERHICGTKSAVLIKVPTDSHLQLSYTLES